MKIVVLAGGLSTERQVSLTSGTGVCRALRERGHQAILVDMFLGLEDYNGSLSDIFDAPDGLCGDNRVHSTEPDLEAVRRSRRDQGPSMLGKDVLAVCAMADLVFLALHGSCGEDGRIQATLDLLGVPYTGSGYLGSGMAMDKSVTKRIMDAAGVPTAPWHDVRYTREDIPRLARELPVPCAVKIINGGSSIGVELPDTREELAQATCVRGRLMNLQCGATRLYRRNAVCRVACLAWVGWIGERKHPAPQARETGVIPLKPCLQKRLRDGRTAVEIT